METKITSASLRISLSQNYNTFEVALTIENQDGLTLEEIEAFRMQAQEQASAAVEDYKVTMQPVVEKPFVKAAFKANKQVINVSEQDDEPPLKDNASIDEIEKLPLYTPKK